MTFKETIFAAGLFSSLAYAQNAYAEGTAPIQLGDGQCSVPCTSLSNNFSTNVAAAVPAPRVLQKKKARKNVSPIHQGQAALNQTVVDSTARVKKAEEKDGSQDTALQNQASTSLRYSQEFRDRDAALGRRIDNAQARLQQQDNNKFYLNSKLTQVDAQSRRFAMEAGMQYGRSGVNRLSVLAALCYQGNKATFCAGGGVGKAEEATSTLDLTQPVAYERNGEYIEASAQTGTQTNGQRYQWDASLRLAPARGKAIGKKMVLTPSVIANIIFSRERETRDLTRTTQLNHDNQRVGDPVSASGSDTEYRTGAAFVPTAAVDLCRYLWGKDSGKNICARVGVGYDVQNERAVITAGGLARFR